MSRRSNAAIWNYFQKSDNNNKIATCNFCKKTLSYKATTTNLKTHLRFKHISAFNEISGPTLVSRNEGQGAVHEHLDVGVSRGIGSGLPASTSSDGREPATTTSSSAISSSSVSQPPVPFQRQGNISSYLPKRMRPSDRQNIDKCLMKMIAYDFQPFSIVEDDGFKEFTSALNPSYQLPDRKTISNVMLPMIYEDRLQYFKKYIKDNAVSVCLTADTWSSKALDHYMAVTAHFLTDGMEYKSILLSCACVEGSHTGNHIRKEINDIIMEWELTNKINYLVTDNAANMIVASNLLEIPHFGCFAHKLNLIVQDSVTHIKDTIDKVSKTVAHFKRSLIAKERLLKYQSLQQNIAIPKTLIRSIPTRWNSTYLMLERFAFLEEALKATIPLLPVNLPIIPNEEWKCITQTCDILKPFYEATKIMSGQNYLCASSALVMSNSLISICNAHFINATLFQPIKDLARALTNGLKERLGNLEFDKDIALCTLLDPRFKDEAFKDTTA